MHQKGVGGRFSAVCSGVGSRILDGSLFWMSRGEAGSGLIEGNLGCSYKIRTLNCIQN